MIPLQLLAQIGDREDGADDQGDDFLHRFELGGGIYLVADAVGGHRHAILEEGDPQLTSTATQSTVEGYLS